MTADRSPSPYQPYQPPAPRLPAYQRLAELTARRYGWPPPGSEPPPAAVAAGPAADTPCVCGRVCVCAVPAGVVRSVASFVAEWHPTDVHQPNPAAEHAEDATPCRCGQTFCGYRILARTMRRSGACPRV